MNLRAHKIELRPTGEQAERLAQTVGVARALQNYLLAHFKQDGVKWSQAAAGKLATEWRNDPAFPWRKEVSSMGIRNAVERLDSAFKKFFKNCKAGKPGKKGFPRFRKKGIQDSYKLGNSGVTRRAYLVGKRKLNLEKIPGLVDLRTLPRYTGELRSVTVSYKAGKWYASLLFQLDEAASRSPHQGREPRVGVDVGLTRFATLSDGSYHNLPLVLDRHMLRLAKAQRALARKREGSNNRKKAILVVQKRHKKLLDVRTAAIHQITSDLVKRYDSIVIEDLAVANMLKNKNLSSRIHSAGWGEFKRQLDYKCKWYGVELVLADRFYASSQTCSGCGMVHPEMKTGKEYMDCECGLCLNRDHNAAINLLNYQSHQGKGTIKTARASRRRATPATSVDGSNTIGENS